MTELHDLLLTGVAGLGIGVVVSLMAVARCLIRRQPRTRQEVFRLQHDIIIATTAIVIGISFLVAGIAVDLYFNYPIIITNIYDVGP